MPSWEQVTNIYSAENPPAADEFGVYALRIDASYYRLLLSHNGEFSVINIIKYRDAKQRVKAYIEQHPNMSRATQQIHLRALRELHKKNKTVLQKLHDGVDEDGYLIFY